MLSNDPVSVDQRFLVGHELLGPVPRKWNRKRSPFMVAKLSLGDIDGNGYASDGTIKNIS